MANFFLSFKKTKQVKNAEDAINKGDFTTLNEALEKKPNINDIEQILNYAMKNPDKKTIKETIDIIISSETDPKKQDQIINAALEVAFETGNPEIIQQLLNNLKKPKPESLENLLIKALKLGNPEIIKQLLDKGAEVSEQNIDGLIEIVISAKNKNFDSFKGIVTLLTEKLTKDTIKLLEELRPTKQDKLNEQLAKKLELLAKLEEKLAKPEENREQTEEASPVKKAIEEIIKAVESIIDNRPDDAKNHLANAATATDNPDLKNIADKLRNNVDKMQKIEHHEPVGRYTKQVTSEQQPQVNFLEIS